MAWTIELSPRARKNLDRLDRQIAQRILRFLNDRIAQRDDPRAVGEALAGDKLGEFWKYRVGDYRVVSRIEDGRMVVVAIRIAHRREVYRD